MGRLESVIRDLARELASDALLTDPTTCAAYDCDGLTTARTTPRVVVLAQDCRTVARTVSICARHRVPFVARGSGTGLSGGALPAADGVLIVTTRMRTIVEVDEDNERAVVDPGVVNLDVTRAASRVGLYFAPDPSSQAVCSIGGNVAENSGGSHCLKYGFTTNHVTGLEMVLANGSQLALGGKSLDAPGYDLVGAIVGSEGTLGIVTRVTLRLLRIPERVETVLSAFETIESAAGAVTAIIAAGIIPAAAELMDALAVEAAERAVSCKYPKGAQAVVILELDGPADEVATDLIRVRQVCADHGAFDQRVATNDAERNEIWRGRKSAFAAVGRISPDYYVQDGVVPRTALAATLTAIRDAGNEAGLRVANVFHAGDGNLHPLVLFDDDVPGHKERALRLAGTILDLCLERGGSISGEHGIGVDKKDHMSKMFTEDDLDIMQSLRRAFDPDGLCNPGKVFPVSRLCGERYQSGRDHGYETRDGLF